MKDYNFDFSCTNIPEGESIFFEENKLDLLDFVDLTDSDHGFYDGEWLTFYSENLENKLIAKIVAYKVFNKNGRNRLYILITPKKDENVVLYMYVVKDADGNYGIVEEIDDDIRQVIHEWAFGENKENIQSCTGKKEKGALGIILFILTIPFRLIFAFIKALLGLIGIGLADAGFVKAFKAGFYGVDPDKTEYTVTNASGYTSTVYTRDGKTFYTADGTYYGWSDDGGKTVHSDN
jgi:hypothetical protein